MKSRKGPIKALSTTDYRIEVTTSAGSGLLVMLSCPPCGAREPFIAACEAARHIATVYQLGGGRVAL